MNKWISGIILLCITSVGFAAEQKSTEVKSTKKNIPVQEAPKVKPGYIPQSEITITESNDTLVKEYRIEGKLRAIKVTPKNGLPPYYMIDHEGTGEFVRMGPDMGSELKVPNWILFEW